MDDKIVVVSNVDGRIGLTIPEMHYHRVWQQRGAKISIDRNMLSEAMYDNGVRTLFEEGLLYIEDMEFKKEMGLEAEDAEEPTNILPIDEKIIERMLNRMPIFDFKAAFDQYSRAQQEDIISYAVRNEIMNMEKAEYIKQKTGVDVVRAILNKRANEEVTPDGTDTLPISL